ncbi:4-(cytidine 5'-diphospho)-2-C-methyl-D-erythritol kinase [Lysobacter sp. TY2-98]|uniref:4-(cytidine 5'-diphospho)-2-C-methyl-D-erythritol kinase n=1 Tax=Lysobacter sp. TY2-98 TaxID=2290922 RepID=UPI000E2045BA|nr:4-(cytidine 5'-diphospho)-2-C-methyl-D-erythritol kinase [Lysobacter sp. TY2-98]AXK72563.1 4-(cytidine 5'-diphospho)-2-C-methyl-D-erythritol kinase [Lysobacter sp. TY2-98]
MTVAWSVWPAPAKLNLFLHITGRREDGYHRLQTVFRLLEWGDTIRLRLRDDGRIERMGTSLPGVEPSNDLAIRAAIALKKSANVAQGVDIAIEKRIPAGGGFGGGSSDAATVLVALNRLWGIDWPLERLCELGLTLGADVPVFVLGRNAWAEGVGEILQPLDLRPAWYLIAEPGVHCPTAALFASPDLTRDSPPLKMADFVAGGDPRSDRLGNAFEPVLRAREPVVDATLRTLSQVGPARLTGSGSGCFVEFATRESAEAALRRLPSTLRCRIVAGAAMSPLHRALERFQVSP